MSHILHALKEWLIFFTQENVSVPSSDMPFSVVFQISLISLPNKFPSTCLKRVSSVLLFRSHLFV